MKWFYEIGYRHFRMPWDIGPRKELVDLVESGRVQPCRTIDLGSGTASNCVYLAQRGFEVTGIDYALSAVELGRKRAQEAGVQVNFLVDDLTNLQHVQGPFDFLVDYGTLDDLSESARDLYVENVIPLTKPGSKFLLYGFEWETRFWEKPFYQKIALKLGELERRMKPYFTIECLVRETAKKYFQWPNGYAVYLMTRN